jgi:4a-hydroxytetrahydrobiopterin dehydratase
VTEPATPQPFHQVGWRVLRERPVGGGPACTHFRTTSLAAGAALVDAIARLTDAADHHLDVDLRPDGVTVRLRTDSADGLSDRHLALARQISAAARELGVPVDLTGLQMVQVAIDALVLPDVVPFWRAVLGYREVNHDDLADPHFEGPPFWFQQMDAPRPQRNRIHIDLYVPHDQAEARVAAAIAAGGHLVSDEHAPR